MNKDILILNSELRTYKFDDGREVTKNRVTYAFQETPNTDTKVGYDVFYCNISSESFDITKKLRPNEIVKARLETKRSRENPNNFQFVIASINNVEV